jgi:hypothetical protein
MQRGTGPRGMGNSEVSVWAWFKKEELGPTRMSDLISLCISRSHAIISVMGPHAGEQSDTIFQRKIGDISRIGWTLWLIKSYKAKPDRVQAMCRRTPPPMRFSLKPEAQAVRALLY